MEKTLIIIPTYNEINNIKNIVQLILDSYDNLVEILIVDDNFANRQLLLEVAEGLAVCNEVAGGKFAINRFKEILSAQPYDLILLNIAMPGMDGLQVLREIRAIEEKMGKKPHEQVSVVIITAYKELFVEAFRLGCLEYLMKPVDIGALQTIIRKVEERKSQNK